jgi:hypothetical protein
MKDLRGTGDNSLIPILTGTNVDESTDQTENNNPVDSQSDEQASSETTVTEQTSENDINENTDGEISDNISYSNILS